jgi:hypothetical protein
LISKHLQCGIKKKPAINGQDYLRNKVKAEVEEKRFLLNLNLHLNLDL